MSEKQMTRAEKIAAYYANMTPEEKEELKKKRVEAIKKRKENDPEGYKKSQEKRTAGIRKANEKRTPEEKKAQTARAKQVMLEKGYSEESKKKMSESAKKYFENNKEEFQKRYETRKETLSNKSEEEKELVKENQLKARLNSEKVKSSYLDPIRNEKISNHMKSDSNPMKNPEIAKKLSEKYKGVKMTGERLLRQQQVIQDIFEKYGNRGLKVQKFKVNGITCQGSFEKAYLDLLIETNQTLPKEKKNYYKTPEGYYHPDFEFDDKLIEIKSDYTFNIFVGRLENINGEKVISSQLHKIIYVGKNIKPVILYIMTKTSDIKKEFIIGPAFTNTDYENLINYIP